MFHTISLPTPHFAQSHFPLHTSHNLTSHSTLRTISLPTPHFAQPHFPLHTSHNLTSHFTLHTISLPTSHFAQSHFPLHTSHNLTSHSTLLITLFLERWSLAFILTHRYVIIPSPGYRYLQVSRFISKSRRKRRGICPETGRCHSRRTRATSMVLTTRGTSRTHLRGILSVLGQPWMALIRRERNCDRRRPSLCSTIWI